jgi:hypothetical protein
MKNVPAGYTFEHDSDAHVVGYVYSWDDARSDWRDCNVEVPVMPDQRVDEAFQDAMGCPMWYGYAVFFVNVGYVARTG